MSDESGTDPDFKAGDMLCQGRFLVRSYIHRGGVGAVYLAHDTQLDEQIVCKVAHGSDEHFWSEFRLQFKKLVTIRSADVVKPLGLFVHGSGTGARPVIALEWIDGIDFGTWVQGDGNDVHKRLIAISRIAKALAELHDAGLAHGDLVGGNVRVTSDRVVLIDVDSDVGVQDPRRSDRASLGEIITKLLPDYAKRTLARVVTELAKRREDGLSMRDVAAQISGIAVNTPLLDLSGPLFMAAVTSHKDAIARREERYEFLRRQRMLSIDGLAQRIKALAEPFGFPTTINENSETKRSHMDPGFFAARQIEVKGDRLPALRWVITFEQVDAFTKPYPYNRVLIGRGKSWIASDGGQQRVDLLEIRLHEEAPVIFAAEDPAFEARRVIRSSLSRLTKEPEPKWSTDLDDWLKRCFSTLTGQSIG